MATNETQPVGGAWDDLEQGRAPACDLADSGRSAVLSWSHLVV